MLPDTDELGRSTWNLLHTMAAYYPDKPNNEEKKNMSDTLTNLSKVSIFSIDKKVKKVIQFFWLM